jgi:hypothetical protein
MDLMAYRAIEANRRRSRLVAGLNAAILACLFAFAVWIFGPTRCGRPRTCSSPIGSAIFGGREVVFTLLGARELIAPRRSASFADST